MGEFIHKGGAGGGGIDLALESVKVPADERDQFSRESVSERTSGIEESVK